MGRRCPQRRRRVDRRPPRGMGRGHACRLDQAAVRQQAGSPAPRRSPRSARPSRPSAARSRKSVPRSPGNTPRVQAAGRPNGHDADDAAELVGRSAARRSPRVATGRQWRVALRRRQRDPVPLHERALPRLGRQGEGRRPRARRRRRCSQARRHRQEIQRDQGQVRRDPGRRRRRRSRRRSRPAASTCSAPSATRAGASTTSCAAAPAVRAIPAAPSSTCRSKTT